MYLHSLTLINVRQFDQRTFMFRPGFNLLVGENGAGKTTILRGMLAALGSAQNMGRRPRLEDSDIRLRTRVAQASAIVRDADGTSLEFQYSKELFERGRLTGPRGDLPLTLLYSSNEAVCSAMKSKPEKKFGGVERDPLRRSEEFLYASEVDSSQVSGASGGRQFGSSQSVRDFVRRMLRNFSPGMGDFYWRFEPYDCSLVLADTASGRVPLAADLQRQARAFAMRWFAEELLRQKRGINWPDQARLTLSLEGSGDKRADRRLPHLRDIWEDMSVSSADRRSLMRYSLEIKLTPRIMMRREIGTFSLSQLSDGEQRLFSLFVDIARQLLINHPHGEIGQGDAIILIDEIDVHLHPKWQRQIVPALEELFPNCQFIATTHSPFVIQATRREQISAIDTASASIGVSSGGNSIEDIAEDIQGISVPQRSVRAERLNAAAKRYFELLELRANDAKKVTPAKLRAAERSYREASEPFTSEPAVHALLRVFAMEGKR
ncbi:AAA family ATPase [Rubrivivax sp. RP6-9]|jgi:predicted ATPase|uniref:AAA family ATPase n=1 Tax=Rubrivivax sp. RP6-9 TaxID=3415750 RepID=UPI003CC627D5